MILSRESRARILVVDSGFFLDRVLVGPDSFETQIIVKAPFEIISAVHYGAEMFLWSGFAGAEHQKVLAATFTMEDDPDVSFYLSRTLASDEAHHLMTFLEERHAHVSFYDEFNRNLLIVYVSIADNANLDEVRALIDREIPDPNDAQIEAALNDIEARACCDPRLLKYIRLMRGEETMVYYLEQDIGFIPPSQGEDRYSRETHVEQDAGYKLEERVAQLLLRRFSPQAIFVSPQLRREQRELCDVMIGCPWGYLFLEAKAMSVSETALSRSTERRVAGVRKQIEKALKQLDGVRRRVTGPGFVGVVCGLNTWEIEWYRHALLHFGIVVSEIHPDLNRLQSEWEEAIVRAEANKIALHLFDPTELQRMLKLSKNEEVFFQKLVHRWALARKRRTLVLHIAQKA